MDHSKAHPAEAATRENTDHIAILRQLRERGYFTSPAGPTWARRAEQELEALDYAISKLSTNQQQGDAEAFDQWFNATENFSLRSERAYAEILPGSKALLPRWLRAAFDAGRLSRPPQPDTVTEEMVEAGAQGLSDYLNRCTVHMSGQKPKFGSHHREYARAALTAALAARGK